MAKGSLIAYQGHGTSTANRYTSIMLRLLAEADFHTTGAEWQSYFTPSVRAVVLNWLFNDRGDLLFSYVVPFCRFLLIRVLGKDVVFVHHNTIPHDCRHPTLAKVLLWLCYSNARVLIAHNNVDFESLKRTYGNKVLYIPHPHYYGEYGLPVDFQNTGPLVVGFFGLLRPYKNIELLIEAFRSLPTPHNMVLRIQGKAMDPQYTVSLTELVRGDERIQLVEGFVPDDEVTAVLASLDVVALPYDLGSSSNSGAGILAMSYGKPILVPEIPGFAEWPLTAPYRYHYRFENEHRVALTSALAQLSKKSRAEIVAEGRRLQQFGLETLSHERVQAGLDRLFAMLNLSADQVTSSHTRSL